MYTFICKNADCPGSEREYQTLLWEAQCPECFKPMVRLDDPPLGEPLNVEPRKLPNDYVEKVKEFNKKSVKQEKLEIAELKKLLTEDPEAAIQGMTIIYGYQTVLERQAGATTDDNGVGFTGTDAEFLTSLMEQHSRKGWLSQKQTECLMKKAGKYAGQLYRLRKEKEKAMSSGPK